MIAHADFSAFYAAQKMLLFFAQLLLCILTHELERRHGLWHKAGYADGYLYAAPFWLIGILIIQIDNALCRFGNALDIPERLGRQAQHKVKFHRGIARVKGKRAGAPDLILGDIFVDHIPQALRAGLGREGKAAFAHRCCLAHKRFRKIIDA